jgi:hypothetical protein
MKNTVRNSLEYSGIVTLSKYVGNKKVQLARVHNTGGNYLFDFFTDCLLGDFDAAKAKRPTKIKLLQKHEHNDKTVTYESASPFIFLLTRPKKLSPVDGKSRVLYSFMIHRDMFEEVTDFASLAIGLYSNGIADDTTELEKFAASCNVGLSRTDLTSASLLVDWELIIANGGTAVAKNDAEKTYNEE